MPASDLDLRHGALELGAHLALGSTAMTFDAAADELPRQLPRAGSEIEHRAPGTQLEPLDEPVDRLGG